MITESELLAATGAYAEPFSVDACDIVSGSSAPRILTFLDDAAFLEPALSNPAIRVLLTTAAVKAQLPVESGFRVVEVDDPRWTFYTLTNYLTSQLPEPAETVIDERASVSPLAFVAERGVQIAAGAIVEPFAAIHSGVHLAEGVIVRSGAVIGCPGFEHKRTSRGVLSVAHDGGVWIGARTEVGALANIAKGFLRRQTVIGSDVRIDGLSHIAHSCMIGDEVFIAAGVTISGSVTIGKAAWLGPGSVIRDGLRIGDHARVALGSTVLRDVPDNGRVAGNPARGQLPG